MKKKAIHKTKILIVDDHPMFRKGMRAALSEVKEFTIAGEAGTSSETFKFMETHNVDLIILDYQLAETTGIEISQRVKKLYPKTKIILLTMFKEAALFEKSSEYGIDAYLLKENAADEILKAIHVVMDGNFYLCQTMSEFILQKQIEQKNHSNSGFEQLTKTEKNILRSIAKNKTTKEIAREMFVSGKTIENHRANICRKLHISGNNALLKFIIQHKELM